MNLPSMLPLPLGGEGWVRGWFVRTVGVRGQKQMTAGQIADCFAISKPSISHHLDLLKQADLIVAEKNGQFIVYSLSTSVLDDCIAWLMKLKKKRRYEKTKNRMAATADPRA